MAHPQIAAFARLAKENEQPTRLIAGQRTLLSRTMHDIRYDEVNDEMLVTNPFARAILVFRGGANGEEAPIRVIQGSRTQLESPDRLEVDPINNEIIVPEGNKVLVFRRTGNGDEAPIRILQGLQDAGSVAVDPVHDLLVIGLNGRQTGGSLLIFNRTDSGTAKPKAEIRGPKTGIIRINQMEINAEKGWIVATQPGIASEQDPEGIFVGVWSINDNGDVPPRWRLAGPKSGLKKPRGVALNYKNKELIIADMRLNSVFTYSFPEIF